MRWAPRNSRSPASVGSTRRPERSSSWVPRRFSSARTWSETAGCVTPSRSAACEKLRRSTTAQKAASWRVSISEAYLRIGVDEISTACGDGARYGRRMKVWIDMTNSPHVPFFRPLIRLLEERGHEVSVSARDFAQTLELLDAAGDRTRGRRPAPRRRRAGGQGAGDGVAPARAPRLGQAAARSTSRSPTPPTSFPSPPARCGCARRMPTTTSSPGPSTRSARARRRGSSLPRRSRRSGSTGWAHAPRRCAATPG